MVEEANQRDDRRNGWNGSSRRSVAPRQHNYLSLRRSVVIGDATSTLTDDETQIREGQESRVPASDTELLGEDTRRNRRSRTDRVELPPRLESTKVSSAEESAGFERRRSNAMMTPIMPSSSELAISTAGEQPLPLRATWQNPIPERNSLRDGSQQQPGSFGVEGVLSKPSSNTLRSSQILSHRRKLHGDKIRSEIIIRANHLADLGGGEARTDSGDGLKMWRIGSSLPAILNYLQIRSALDDLETNEEDSKSESTEEAAASTLSHLRTAMVRADHAVRDQYRNAPVLIFGDYRVGKSFVFAHLAGLSGKVGGERSDAERRGLAVGNGLERSVRILNVSDETVGFRTLMEVSGLGMPEPVNLRSTQEERVALYVDGEITDSIMQESLLQISKLAILVVRDMNGMDQRNITMLARRIAKRQVPLERLIVVHNLRDINDADEMNEVWKRQIHEKFPSYVDERLEVPVPGLTVPREVRFARTSLETVHVTIANRNSAFGVTWNAGVFSLLRIMVTTHCGRLAKGINPLESFLSALPKQIRTYAANVCGLRVKKIEKRSYSEKQEASFSALPSSMPTKLPTFQVSQQEGWTEFGLSAVLSLGTRVQTMQWHLDRLSNAPVFERRDNILPYQLSTKPEPGPKGRLGYFGTLQVPGCNRSDVRMRLAAGRFSAEVDAPLHVPADAELVSFGDLYTPPAGHLQCSFALPPNASADARDAVIIPAISEDPSSFRGLIRMFFPVYSDADCEL